jgi:hypothetical protein
VKTLRFIDDAWIEMSDAAAHYSRQVPGLGLRFLKLIQKSLDQIISNPERFPVQGTVRKCILLKFPYSIIFRVDSDEIAILAIAHSMRRANYWVNRN